MDHKANLRAYAHDVQGILDQLPWDDISQCVEALWQCCQRGGQIFTMGNGGHANTASHMTNDIAKHTITSDDKDVVAVEGVRFRTQCLNDNISLLTAIGNDMGYEHVFSEQVANSVKAGDVVIGVSVSGNSPNVLRAFEEAKRRGARVICFSGFDGGKARALADINIIVPCQKGVQAEDIHLMIAHMVSDELKRLAQNRQEIKG